MSRPAHLTAGLLLRAFARPLPKLALSLTLLLSACGPRTGDFGRPIPDPVSFRALAADAGDVAAAMVDPDAWEAGGKALERGFIGVANRVLGEPRPDIADNKLTGVERELRQRLWHFRQDVPDWPETTPNARYNALADAIAVDSQLLPSLIELRLLVREKDHIRAAALPAFSTAGKAERSHVAGVGADNEAKIAEICLHARRRATTYRRELERLVLTAPEDEAITAERGLDSLERLIGAVCLAAPPAAKVQPRPPRAPHISAVAPRPRVTKD